MTEQRKIVIFSRGKARVELFDRILREQGVEFATAKGYVCHDLLGVTTPDYHQKLNEWAAKGFTECIIDSGTFKDDDVVAGVKAYATDANKPAGAKLRPIVIFKGSADPLSGEYAQLVGVGVYDFIIPQECKDLGLITDEEACKLVLNPHTYSDVQAYRRATGEAPVAPKPEKPAKEPVAKVQTVTKVETVKIPVPTSRRAIAVATTAKRGGSTTLAMRLARCLYNMHQSVAVLTDAQTVRSLWSFSPERVPGGRSGIPTPVTFKGVDFYIGDDPCVLPAGYDYAIIDYGNIDFSSQKEELPAKMVKAAKGADARFLSVPMGTPADWQSANTMVTNTREMLNNWTVCFWGIGGKSTEMAAVNIKRFSPKASVVQLDFTPFPLSLSEAEPKIVDLLCATHLIGNPLRNKYGTKTDGNAETSAEETKNDDPKPAKKGLFNRLSRKGKDGETNG